MAASRLDKIANIFSRATGLLRTGAVKYEDRPIWYDVYRVFPPKYEPRYNREVDPSIEIKPIFYEEDLVRAQFFEKYGLNPGGMVRDLKTVGVEDDCQRFVNSYNEIKKSNPNWAHSEVFEATTKTIVNRSSSLRDDPTYQDETTDTVRRRGQIRLLTQDSLRSMFDESIARTKNDPKKSS